MDTRNTEDNTAFDNPWKNIIEIYFDDFLSFFFEDIYKAVDWSKKPVFLDKELEQVMRDAETGRNYVDKLVKVFLNNGQQTVLYIHIEVQSQYDSQFSKRMFIYHYRLFDRYQLPLVSLAVLGDDRPQWKPKQYSYKNFNCKQTFEFPSVKLLDYREDWQALEQSKNPFSIVVRVHLKALETRRQPQERLKWKFSLFKALYQEGYGREDILKLFHFMDWMLNLPKEVEQQFTLQASNYEEQKKMQYVTSIERMGIEQGLRKGQLSMLRDNTMDVLRIRFHQIPSSITQSIQKIDSLSVLSMLHKQAVQVESLLAFQQVLNEHKDIN